MQALTVALAQRRGWKPVLLGGGALPSSGGFSGIPFVSKGLDLFGHGWQVADSFVSAILGIFLVAGAVLA